MLKGFSKTPFPTRACVSAHYLSLARHIPLPTWHNENCNFSLVKRVRVFGLSRSTWAVKAAEHLSIRGFSGHAASALWLDESNNIPPFLFPLLSLRNAAGKASD